MKIRGNVSTGGGIGFFGLLGIVFIILKLFGVTVVAQWSWFWVLSPVWGPFAIALVTLLIIGIVAFLIESSD